MNQDEINETKVRLYESLRRLQDQHGNRLLFTIKWISFYVLCFSIGLTSTIMIKTLSYFYGHNEPFSLEKIIIEEPYESPCYKDASQCTGVAVFDQ